MANLKEMRLISDFEVKKCSVQIYRDKWGKFYVINNEVMTQRKLNAEEVVHYLSWAANEAL